MHTCLQQVSVAELDAGRAVSLQHPPSCAVGGIPVHRTSSSADQSSKTGRRLTDEHAVTAICPGNAEACPRSAPAVRLSLIHI